MHVIIKNLILIFIFLFSFCIIYSSSFNVCNVDIEEPWFEVKSSIGEEVLIIDNSGNFYFPGKPTSLIHTSSDTFEINNIYFNLNFSSFTSFSFDESNLNSYLGFKILNSQKDIVSVISPQGNIYTKGKGVYDSSQASCFPDGIYCNGGTLEYRDYFCSLIDFKNGYCDYQVLSSENCLTKFSEDSDGGINRFIQGTVTDYTGCSDSSCTNNKYTDYCISGTNLLEYFSQTNSFSSINIDCSADNYYYCDGNNRYLQTYDCAGGKCSQSSSLFIQTCTQSAPTYSSWSCSSTTTLSRTVTTYTAQCSSSGCSQSSSETTEISNCNSNQYCSGGSCYDFTYSWKTGTWSSCSVSCGGGTQTRSVWCERNDGVIVSDSYCSGTKPATSQSCNTQSCNPPTPTCWDPDPEFGCACWYDFKCCPQSYCGW